MSDRAELPYQDQEEHFTAVTINVPSWALDGVLSSKPILGAENTFADCAENACIPVFSASAEQFTIYVKYGENWERTFDVNTQTTLFDLAKAFELATGFEVKKQILDLSDVKERRGRDWIHQFCPSDGEDAVLTLQLLDVEENDRIVVKPKDED